MVVLVDSSVWIDASRSKSRLKEKLGNLIDSQNESLVVCHPVIVEVCQGAKSQNEFDHLWNAFLGFECLEIGEKIWEKSAWNYFQCRKAGVTTSTVDCLIATLSLEYRVKLWSVDQIFKKMKPILGLELFN